MTSIIQIVGDEEEHAMKVSKQKMAEHREQIIEAAAKRFREKGFDGISVAELMKEVGLTHGGFYGHFTSKEELVSLASQRAMRSTSAKWARVIGEAPGDPLAALAKDYLSTRHQDHPEAGCLFAALGGELGRQPVLVKQAVMEVQLQFLDILSRVVPGRTKAARRQDSGTQRARSRIVPRDSQDNGRNYPIQRSRGYCMRPFAAARLKSARGNSALAPMILRPSASSLVAA